MTHSTGLPMITVGTPAWGVAVNDAFTEANARLTRSGALGPSPRDRSDDSDAFDGLTPNWIGQLYVQTTPFVMWVAIGVAVDDWRRVDSLIDFTPDRMSGETSPLHAEADDIVTNAGLVPAFIGQRYFQTTGGVLWFSTGLTNENWARVESFALPTWTTEVIVRTDTAVTKTFTASEIEITIWGAGGAGAGATMRARALDAEASTLEYLSSTITVSGGVSGVGSVEGKPYPPSQNFPAVAGTTFLEVRGAGAGGGQGGESGTVEFTTGDSGGAGSLVHVFINKTASTTTLVFDLATGAIGSAGGTSGESAKAILRYR